MERQNYDRVENPDPLKLLPHSGEIQRRPIQRKSLQHVSKQGQVRLLTLVRDVTRQFSPGVQPEFLSKTCQKFFNRCFFFFFFFFLFCWFPRSPPHYNATTTFSKRRPLSLSLSTLSAAQLDVEPAYRRCGRLGMGLRCRYLVLPTCHAIGNPTSLSLRAYKLGWWYVMAGGHVHIYSSTCNEYHSVIHK